MPAQSKTALLNDIANLRAQIAQLEIALAHQAETATLYHTLADSLPGAVSIFDRQGNICYLNLAAAQMFQVDPDSAIGQNIRALMSLPTVHAILQQIEHVCQSGNPAQSKREYLFQGRSLWLSTTYTLLRLPSGEPRVLATIRDMGSQVQIENTLRENKARAEAILKDQTELICRFLPDHTLTFVNEAYCHYFGKRRDELIGNKFVPLIPLEDHARISRLLQQRDAKNPVVMYEHRVIMPNGEIRWQQWSDRAIFDAAGQLAEIQSVGRDITQRKEIELALHASEHRLQLALQAGHAGIWEWDLISNRMYWSEECFRLLDYAPDSIEPTFANWTARIHPADRVAAEAEVYRAINQQSELDITYRLLLPDQPIRWAHLIGKIITGDDNQHLKMIGMQIDVTKAKLLERQLQQRDARWRGMFEVAGIAIAITDLEGRWLEINPAFEKMIGYLHGELYLHPIADITASDDRVMLAEKIADLVARRVDVIRMELRLVRQDGAHLWIDLSLTPILHDGHVVALLGAGFDITERKLNEDKLRAAQNNMLALIENSDSSIWSIDRAYRLVVANSIFHREIQIGLGRPVAIGDNLFASEYPQTTLDKWRGYYDRALAGEKFTIEMAHDFEPGRWSEYHFNPIRDEHGTVIGVTVLGRDITARKQAEQKLAQSEAKYRLLAENSDDVIWTLNTAGKITYVSPSVLKLRGYTPDEIIQQSVADALMPELAQKFQSEIARFMEQLARGEQPILPLVYELEQPRKDGSTVWTENVISPILDAAGHFTGFVGISRDITTRHQADQALRESETRYRLLADASSDVIWTCGLDFRLTYISPAVTRLTGFTPAEALRHTFADTFTASSVERAQTLFHQAVAHAQNGNPTTDESSIIELEMHCKDGSTVWTETRLDFIFDAHGKPQMIVGITRDVSERRRIEAEREAQRRTSQLAQLYAKTSDLGTLLEMPVLLETLLQRAAELLPIAGGALFLFDAPRNEFVASQTLGVTAPDDWRVPFNAAAFDANAFIAQVAPADAFALPSNAPQMRATLKYADQLLGVLTVSASTPAFTPTDRQLLSLFAERAAAAIYNVQSFEHVRASRERVQALAHQLLETQETERRTIARELHDEIGQALTSVQLNLQSLDAADSENQDTLEDTMHTIEHVMEQVRDLSRTLRPSMLDDFGLAPALKWYLERQAKRAGFHAAFHADEFTRRLPEEIETVCFRIAQEALTNIARHARAENVTVELRQFAHQLTLTIRDDGRGFDPTEALRRASTGNSFGLLGMRERVTLIGGDLTIESAPAQGTRIGVQIPLVIPAFVERRRRLRGKNAAD